MKGSKESLIISKQEELINTYKEYIQLLGDESSELVSIAFVHGWRSTRYDQGEKFRKKIEKLANDINSLNN